MKLFLEKGPTSRPSPTPCLMGCAGINSLGWAAYNGHTQTVLFLYEKGAGYRPRHRGPGGLIPGSIFGFGFDHAALRRQTSYGIKLLQRLGTDRGSIKAAAVKSIPVIRSSSASLIAVIDFKADGVSYQEARKVSEWLRTELINTGQFQVIERSAMDAISRNRRSSKTGARTPRAPFRWEASLRQEDARWKRRGVEEQGFHKRAHYRRGERRAEFAPQGNRGIGERSGTREPRNFREKNLANGSTDCRWTDRGMRRMDRMYAIHTSHPFPSFRRIRFRRGRIYATPTETDTVPE